VIHLKYTKQDVVLGVLTSSRPYAKLVAFFISYPLGLCWGQKWCVTSTVLSGLLFRVENCDPTVPWFLLLQGYFLIQHLFLITKGFCEALQMSFTKHKRGVVSLLWIWWLLYALQEVSDLNHSLSKPKRL